MADEDFIELAVDAAYRDTPQFKRDRVELEAVLQETRERAINLLQFMGTGLNRYSEVTARADCLRLIRAAVELAPTVKQ